MLRLKRLYRNKENPRGREILFFLKWKKVQRSNFWMFVVFLRGNFDIKFNVLKNHKNASISWLWMAKVEWRRFCPRYGNFVHETCSESLQNLQMNLFNKLLYELRLETKKVSKFLTFSAPHKLFMADAWWNEQNIRFFAWSRSEPKFRDNLAWAFLLSWLRLFSMQSNSPQNARYDLNLFSHFVLNQSKVSQSISR